MVSVPPVTDLGWARIHAELGPVSGQGFDLANVGIPNMRVHRTVSVRERQNGISTLHAIGQIHQTIVSADDVSQAIIHAWPEDQIGKPFDPAPGPGPIGGNVVGINRATRLRRSALAQFS